MKFFIGRKLPSLNDVIRTSRGNKYGGNYRKKELEEEIGFDIMQAVSKGTLTRIERPVRIDFIWHEPTMARDKDNVASAKKFILDALQKYGILPNDNNHYITGFTDRFVYRQGEGVMVELTEETENANN